MSVVQKFRLRLYKLLAISQKNILLDTRFKGQVIVSYITPIISIIMPMIVLGKFFEIKENFGSWTSESYFVFLFIGYCIILMKAIILRINRNFMREMYWKTLPALMIAPINRMYLLFGAVLSYFFIIIVPLSIFLTLAYLLFPISFLTLIIVLIMLFMILGMFASFGLILGAFIISNESINKVLGFVISLVFWASCITYPFELFPEEFQMVISFNPIYYIIDIFRYAWIEDNILLTIVNHPNHSIIFLFMCVLSPIIGLYLFNYVYKKLGIQGY